MTKKFINRVMIIGVIYLIMKYVILDWQSFHQEAKNFLYFCCFFIGVVLLIAYWLGEFDTFFRIHTDPFFEKVCNFINRKNGGCNES